ncbi:MAG TPA: prolyl oligopeptidase family serine peptidase [Tepidisphaeraceae bacterium]|jgi:prolyl oligopeptidase|nr:prolyl oligopeptidase family serine peptidase [Tepidisphaeraceae bacterium]
MKALLSRQWSAGIVTALLVVVPALATETKIAEQPTPPVAPVQPVVDDYFGVKVTDPYRYMENLEDPPVAAWFKGQNDYARDTLHRIHGRAELLARIKELGASAPARVFDIHRMPGGRYFYEKRLASEDVARLYMRDGLDGAEKLIVDPGKYPAPVGSHNAISYFDPSDDGNWVAAGISASGSENAVIHIIDLQNNQEAKETLDRARFGGINWRPDNHSFYYNQLQKLGPKQPATDQELNSKCLLHVVGTDPQTDIVVLAPGLTPSATVAPTDSPFVVTIPGCAYALGMIEHGVLNEATIYAAPIETVCRADIPWKKICDVDDDVTGFTVHGDDLYLLSHKGAPKFKVLHTSLAHPDMNNAAVVVPQGSAVINNIAAAQDGLYVQQVDGGLARLERVAYAGGEKGPRDVALPFQGAITIDNADPRVAGLILELSTWTQAYSIYSYNPTDGKVTDTHLTPLGKFDRPGDIVSEEVKVESYDGTMVPLSIIHRRDIRLDGSNPTLLDGYGAYGMTIDPYFGPLRLAWLEHGGVFAEAHVRGGGEYGEDWHKWGEKLTKPNTWRDFIACGQYLVDHRYTSPARLAGEGASAGGITIGRAITERPDLFAAALDQVGVSNALRSEFSPNGPPNIPEFGSVKTQPGFEDLYTMDAYHHVRDGVKYPAVLVTTGWNDPRVASWEPGKMAARLQAASAGVAPILLRVDYAAGHGMGSTKTQFEEESADAWSFLLWQFKIPGFELEAKTSK